MLSLTVVVTLLGQAAGAGAGVGAKVTPPRPAAPPKPVQTSFEGVLAGRHRTGLVSFPAVVLPATAIQVTSGGRTSYYALAVAPDSAYMTAVKAAVASLGGPGREAVQRLAGAIDQDAAYRKALDEEAQIVGAAKVKVDPAEALAVELSGFEVRADAYKWETIVDKRSFQPIKMPPLPAYEPLVATTEGAMARIKKLAEKHPPNLDEKMPNLNLVRSFSLTKPEADAYNAMVQAFNAELKRRRAYAVQAIEEDLLFDLARMGRLASAPPTTLVAAPATGSALAVETLTKIHGTAPKVFLRERSPAGDPLAKRLFESTSVLVTSYPRGAMLTLNGEPKGETPVLLADLPSGSSLDVALSREGFAPLTRQDKASVTPDGVKRLEYVLDASAKP